MSCVQRFCFILRGIIKEIKSKSPSFKEIIYSLPENVKHSCRSYEDFSKKTWLYGILTKMFNLDLILRKQTNQHCRTFSKTTVLNSSKVSMSWHQQQERWGQDWSGTVFSSLEETVKRHGNHVCLVTCGWILDQKCLLLAFRWFRKN